MIVSEEEEDDKALADLLLSSESSNNSEDTYKVKEEVKTYQRAKTTAGKPQQTKKSKITPIKHQNTSTIKEVKEEEN